MNCVYSPVCRAYLSMLERTVENLTDCWQDEPHQHLQEENKATNSNIESQEGGGHNNRTNNNANNNANQSASTTEGKLPGSYFKFSEVELL